MGGEKMNKKKVFSIFCGVAAVAAAVVIVGRRPRKLPFKWRWGCITLSDVDECVSRSVGRASLSHPSFFPSLLSKVFHCFISLFFYCFLFDDEVLVLEHVSHSFFKNK
jgi:hypothetical protein